MREPHLRHLLDCDLDELTSWLAEREQPAYRAKQIAEWVYVRGVATFDEMTNLSRDLRRALGEAYVIRASTVAVEQKATDGTNKWLVRWPDDATSECVLIPDDDRRTVCISSQVGCPVRCRFCASGVNGLARQLSAGQIVEQVLHARGACGPDARLTNVVFMGIGEPLANYDEVLRAVRTLHAPWGLNLGARRITISTVGLPAMMRRLANEGLPVNLALSLHATTDALRRELIPWSQRVTIAELIDASRYFFERTGREVTLEYVLLDGVNMRTIDVQRLGRLVRQLRCNVNLIPFNPVVPGEFRRPSDESIRRFTKALRAAGVNAHARRSRGLDIDAACGQLRQRRARETIETTETQP